MVVVSDTTAISNLFQIGKLDLLRDLFSEIVIPEAVEKELTVLEEFGIPIRSALVAPWIRIVEVKPYTLVSALLSQLDKGES